MSDHRDPNRFDEFLGMVEFSGNARGIAAMCLAMASFVSSDVCTKLVTGSVPVSEAIAFRNGLATLVIGTVVGLTRDVRHLPSVMDRLVLLRCLADTSGAFLFLYALTSMNLGDLTAIQQIVPLILTAFGALVLRERIEYPRLSAILVGLGGALLIANPRGLGLGTGAILAFVTAFTVAARDLLVRRIDLSIPPLILALGSVWLPVLVAPVVSLARGWHRPDGREFALMAGAAAGLCLAQLFIGLAMRLAEVRAVAPFYYTQTVFAVLGTYGVFGIAPSPSGAVGIAMVVGTGLFVVMRERRQSLLRAEIDR